MAGARDASRAAGLTIAFHSELPLHYRYRYRYRYRWHRTYSAHTSPRPVPVPVPVPISQLGPRGCLGVRLGRPRRALMGEYQ